MRLRKIVSSVLLMLLFASALCSCAEQKPTNDVFDIRSFSEKKIGILTGSIHDAAANENLDHPVLTYYNSNADLALALDAGKIDAYVTDEPVWRVLSSVYNDHVMVKRFSDENYAFAFRKNDEKSAAVCLKMNEFLKMIRENGTLKEIDSIWFGDDETKKFVDTDGLTAENGTLTFATTSDIGAPFSYVKNNKYAGYDVDIAVRFCREYGYGIEIVNTSFDGMLASVTAGKSDFCAACITVTSERSESMLFSDADYVGGTVLVVKDGSKRQITSTADLSGSKLGIQTGVAYDVVAKELLPECELTYFNAGTDLAVALEKGKIKSYLIDEPVARMIFRQYPSQRILTILEEESYAWTLPKANPGSEKLCGEMNEFFAKCREDGTFEEIDAIWFGTDRSKQVIDFDGLTAENGTLSMAICSTVGAPFCYIQDNQFAGYDLDFAVRFCRAYGYGLKITDYDLPGLFSCLASGKCDFGACCITITEDRKETMLFCDPNYQGGIAVIVNDLFDVPKTEKNGFFSSIADSFHKTFIRENRYRLFLSGIGTTVLVVLLSLLFGTLIGFGVYLLYYRLGKPFRAFVDVMNHITENTPIVVILMILYYIIFGNVDISGVIVSVIGFTLIFAGAVIGVMKVGVGAVDPGQREAALALGYTEEKAFLKVILPQAAVHFLPGYKSAIVQLIKGTAIVGYIAVQDLTKVSDIVRSRTYEAFFPLIVTAILYFLMAVLTSALVKRIEIGIDPASRKSIKLLNGVRLKNGSLFNRHSCLSKHTSDFESSLALPKKTGTDAAIKAGNGHIDEMIEIRHLRKEYSHATPLQDLDLTVRDGEVVSVIGPSGSGKSTLIRCINRLETPTSGTVTVDSVCVTDKKCDVSAVRRKMGMVFQSFHLFGHLSVIENVMMPQTDLLGADRQTAYDKAMKLLELVGLEGRAMQYPSMLSGGQKQRVAIARTLSTDPDIILFDEPTSALDPSMAGEVQSVIRRLADMGKTMVIVTHDMRFAREVSDRVLFLTNGGICEEGTPERIFDHPQNELTRRFVRRLKVYENIPEENGFDYPAVISEIERFCLANRIPYEITEKIMAATEELTAQILLPKLDDRTIGVCVEYDETRRTAYAKFRYGKEPFDPRTGENKIALTLLNKQCAEIEQHASEEPYANEVILHIR